MFIFFLAVPHAPDAARPSSIDQVDLAPTLAVLLGVPIPQDNIGTLIQPLLARHLNTLDHLNALRLNAHQLLRLLHVTPAIDPDRVRKLNDEYMRIQGRHKRLLYV